MEYTHSNEIAELFSQNFSRYENGIGICMYCSHAYDISAILVLLIRYHHFIYIDNSLARISCRNEARTPAPFTDHNHRSDCDRQDN